MFFARPIGFIHFHAGVDFWTKKSKIASFSILFLVPIAIAIYHAVMVNLGSDDKKQAAKEKQKKE